MHLSPLRYPGGKNRIANFIAQVCVDNRISGLYVEPYAGGASVALFLLFSNVVKKNNRRRCPAVNLAPCICVAAVVYKSTLP